MPELEGADHAPNPWRAGDSPRSNNPTPRASVSMNAAPSTSADRAAQRMAQLVSSTALRLTTNGNGHLVGLEQLVDDLGRLLDTPVELHLASDAADLHWTVRHDELERTATTICRELHGFRASLALGSDPEAGPSRVLLEAWLDVTLLAIRGAADHRRAERAELASSSSLPRHLERIELLARLAVALPTFPTDFLRAALDNELILHHRPISTAEGVVNASDALPFADPTGIALDALDSLDSPDEALVTSQLTIPLGHRLVSLAIPTLQRLLSTGALGPDHRMHVRMLHRQLANRETTDLLIDLLRGHDVPPGSLAVDVAEPTLLEHHDTISAMTALADHGVAIYLDGFGGAGSNFTLLRTAMLRGVKLSSQVVSGVASDGRQASILSGLIELGVRLGLDIIATGVDDQADLDWLRNAGPISLQGDLIGVAHTEAELLQTATG